MKNLAPSRSRTILPVSGCAVFPSSIMAMLDCCITMCAKSADLISSGLSLADLSSERCGSFMTHYLYVCCEFRPAKNGCAAATGPPRPQSPEWLAAPPHLAAPRRRPDLPPVRGGLPNADSGIGRAQV